MNATTVDLATVVSRQRAALLAADDGELPLAESELTMVVELLDCANEATGRRALADALINRAQVRQMSNRWSDALADFDRALALANKMPVLVRQSVAFIALAGRAKLRARPGTPVHDL